MFNFTNGYGEWHLKYNNMRHTGFSLLALIKDWHKNTNTYHMRIYQSKLRSQMEIFMLLISWVELWLLFGIWKDSTTVLQKERLEIKEL